MGVSVSGIHVGIQNLFITVKYTVTAGNPGFPVIPIQGLYFRSWDIRGKIVDQLSSFKKLFFFLNTYEKAINLRIICVLEENNTQLGLHIYTKLIFSIFIVTITNRLPATTA